MNQLNRKIFTFKNKEYEIYVLDDTGFAITKPLNGLIASTVYETGHYQVQESKFIPIILNLPDFLLASILLRNNGISKLNSLVDFGCGKGYFLYFLKQIGFKKLSGLETSEPRADFAEKLLSFKVYREYYYEGELLSKRWDCITLIHVLEHIENPFNFLDNLVKGAVADGGMIYIEVPNFHSLSSLIAGNSWAHFTPHFHTNHFTIKSLKQYSIEKNLKYKILGTYSFYNGILGMSSAIFSIFGYKGSIFEDLKLKKWYIIVSLLTFLPITFLLELFFSVALKRGSVIKFLILK
jgi:2-polyprenyl-3-methyl-5-hydroxy-6-metoxy-1,4-benzoquinol methylase